MVYWYEVAFHFPFNYFSSINNSKRRSDLMGKNREELGFC